MIVKSMALYFDQLHTSHRHCPGCSIQPPTNELLVVGSKDFGLLLSQKCYAASAVRGDETSLRPHVSLCKDDQARQGPET
jgi:hypothetical protein